MGGRCLKHRGIHNHHELPRCAELGGRCLKHRGIHNGGARYEWVNMGERCPKKRKRIKMKNRIRQILREETSEFDPKMLKSLYQYMNFLTKDYVWYHDTPENRFKYASDSIWLIIPETQKWVLQLDKYGVLWWSYGFYRNFKKYFNMDEYDFGIFIKLWVEDVLNRGVYAIHRLVASANHRVEDVLKNGKQLK